LWVKWQKLGSNYREKDKNRFNKQIRKRNKLKLNNNNNKKRNKFKQNKSVNNKY
jgi:hypothetical protein